MEDPWGASPWTTAAPDNERGPEPPPRAFLTSTASSSGIPGLEFTSPWGGDDDANWAASLNVWSSGGADNTRSRSRENSIHSLAGSRPRSRDNSISGGRAWPAVASPGVAARTLSRSSSNSVLRLPGTQLDPWASETSLELPPSPPKAAVSPGAGTTKFNLQDTIHEASPDPDEFRELDVGSPQWGRDDQDKQDVVETRNTTAEHEQMPDRDQEQKTQETAPHQNGDTTRSRASTSCSEDSRHDHRPQDSPITSIDEDSRPKPPLPPSPMPRKVSAKVSDLAKMFDSASKSSPATSIPRPIPSTRKNFKELVEVARVSSTTTATTVTTSIPRPLPPTRASFQTLVEAANISTQPELPAISVPRPPPPTRANFQELVDKFGSVQYQQELTDKYGDVQFTADLKAVDDLFEKLGLKDGISVDPEDADVSDRIITDTFSSISERRLWYRVSRQGTKRLHDAGGDDYYRRVTWPTSEVRNDTFKIVRRWMEEDAFTGGRPHLSGRGYSGGANKAKGNLFGWDSSVPDEPVNLDEVFKKRQSAPPAPKKIDPTPHVASFGWSSTPSAPVTGFSWSSSMMDAVATPPTQSNGASRPVSMFALSKPLDPPASLAPVDKEEEDDWGEMVTSPGAKGGADPAFSTMQNLDASGTRKDARNSTPKSTTIGPVQPEQNTSESTLAISQPSYSNPQTPADPWDLSFFGATPAAAQTVNGQPTPKALNGSTSRSHSPLPSSTDSKPRKMVAFEDIQDPANEAYEDEVRRVVQNLPDLSYMLR